MVSPLDSFALLMLTLPFSPTVAGGDGLSAHRRIQAAHKPLKPPLSEVNCEHMAQSEHNHYGIGVKVVTLS